MLLSNRLPEAGARGGRGFFQIFPETIFSPSGNAQHVFKRVLQLVRVMLADDFLLKLV